MKRRSIFTTITLFGTASARDLNSKESQSTLNITLTVKSPPNKKGVDFIISITNVSPSVMRINALNSRRGWGALRLQFIDASGASLWVQRRDRDWTGPGTTTSLNPNDKIESVVSSSDTEWSWPYSIGAGKIKKVVAHLDQPAQVDPNLWGGHIHSEIVELAQTLGEMFPNLVD